MYQGIKMNAKSFDMMSRILALIALLIALYNAYLGWFGDKSSSYLSILLVIFISLSILAKEYSKKQNH